MLHNYPESNAFFPCRQIFPAIYVENFDFFHDRGLSGAYRAQNVLRRHAICHEDRYIPNDRREFG